MTIIVVSAKFVCVTTIQWNLGSNINVLVNEYPRDVEAIEVIY